ncbi:hypothetical protein DHEL01_v212911 [Diaporthe helianthi]|uniref:Uncharacterized protein n=1 Tax=Diaporthe helianthi TaxID=158607 RepID=A0A2P5HEL4_DIAHE|nr:hypothetical protein DHEL01_v212911 [Diaporthe helianthi]
MSTSHNIKMTDKMKHKAGPIKLKAEKAAEVLGINPSFPVYEKLVKRLAKCEDMTTTRATRDLNLWVQTGISRVPDLNCALSIFALTEMASDLHRLLIGIR